MSGGLRVCLGLPEIQARELTAQAAGFRRAFSERIGGLNRALRLVASHASPPERQQLENQRMKLYAAFQQAFNRIDSNDPRQARQAIERVIAAVTAVEQSAAEIAAVASARRRRWLQREDDVDEAFLRIGELDEAAHPKAAALRKLCEAIRSRANGRMYQEAITALDQLRPKLEQYLAEREQQDDQPSNAMNGRAGKADRVVRPRGTVSNDEGPTPATIDGPVAQPNRVIREKRKLALVKMRKRLQAVMNRLGV